MAIHGVRSAAVLRGAWLRGALINLDHEPARIAAAREPSQASWSPRNDRVGIGAALEEDVESTLACTGGIEFAHRGEYRKMRHSGGRETRCTTLRAATVGVVRAERPWHVRVALRPERRA
jgi:hypothetical protein